MFEDRPLNRDKVCNSIIQDLGETKVVYSTKDSRIERPPLLNWDLAVVFFYGASQEWGVKYGARAVLKCPVLGTYIIKIICGSGTNTMVEILALWCIIYFACYKKVTRLQLVGDSKVIID